MMYAECGALGRIRREWESERERDGSIRLFYTSEDNWGQPKIDRQNIAQQIRESKRGK